jgi:hypothetical protein
MLLFHSKRDYYEELRLLMCSGGEEWLGPCSEAVTKIEGQGYVLSVSFSAAVDGALTSLLPAPEHPLKSGPEQL